MVRDTTKTAVPSQEIVAEALTRIFVPVAITFGIGLLVLGVVTRNAAAFPLALTGLTVGAIGLRQLRRSDPRPLVLLVVASIGCAINVPFMERGEAVALLPALTLFALIGVFSLPRRASLYFMIWCGALAAWLIRWHLPDMTAREIVVGLGLFVSTGIAGWRLLTMAGDAIVREEENYRLLFDSSPVAILEEDYTAVEAWLDGLREAGVSDLRSYLKNHPDDVRRGISLIEVRQANPAAAKLIHAASADDLVDSFSAVARRDTELESFIEQFVAMWQGRRSLALDLDGVTLEGRPLEAVLHWSVPVSSGKPDLSRVIVAISDITPRKMVEERLARAVEANEQLLAFEKAVAACSRALLLGAGEDALEIALETLRDAMGADRSYLAVNVDDPDLGPSFQVVNAASKPEYARDDWVGMVVPWSKYPMARQSLSRGGPFQHVADNGQGGGWNRSLLAVPVFSGGDWSGTVGFIDIGRRTHWADKAVRMLEVAAPMLGNFWEREVTRKRLEELVQSKDRFVASISHELRTPLSAVLGFAEELANHAATFQPHEATEILELIAEQSRDMADMVEDLLVAARADIGTVSIHADEVYLRSQAEAALVAMGSTGTTTVDIVGGPGKAWADPSRTRQIMRNLLTNAVRYGGSQVVIEATSDGTTTVLTVRDDGPGLDQSEWDRIFEPYERAHDRPTQPGSIGLGLTVSRQLARAMGGDLTYRKDESGSVFELTLPSVPHQADELSVERNGAAVTSGRMD